MPYLIAAVLLAGGLLLCFFRARDAAEAVAGVVEGLAGAARRIGFRRHALRHPVDSVEDGRVAVGAIGCAFLELAGLPAAEDRDRLIGALQSEYGTDLRTAEETVILGRWLVRESGGPQPGFARLVRRLARIDRKGAEFGRLMAVLDRLARHGRGGLTAAQRDALDEAAQAWRLA